MLGRHAESCVQSCKANDCEISFIYHNVASAPYGHVMESNSQPLPKETTGFGLVGQGRSRTMSLSAVMTALLCSTS